MTISSRVFAQWERPIGTRPDAQDLRDRFYEGFSIGDAVESRDEGARLIREGLKTATSELLWSYEADDADPPGAISIVLDGRGDPTCVVETSEVDIVPFSMVDEQFAHDYGEWGATLDGWIEHAWTYYTGVSRDLGREPDQDMPLVCERLRVLHVFDPSS